MVNFTQIEQIVIPGMGSVGLLFNSVVLFVACRYVDFSAKANQMFVVSMTLADMGYCIVIEMTNPFKEKIPHEDEWVHLCGLYQMGGWFCQMASVAFLLLLNIDKFTCIQWPLQYPMWVTEKRIAIATTIMWLFVAGVVSYAFYGYPYGALQQSYTQTPNHCLLIQPHPFFWIGFNMLAYAAPLFLSLLISIAIFIIAQSSDRRSAFTSADSTAHDKRNQVSVMKRILFVFSTTLWSSLTLLPYRILFLKVSLCVEIKWQQGVAETRGALFDVCATSFDRGCRDWFVMLLYMGPVLNPLITITTQRTYRLKVLRLWRRYIKILACAPNDWLDTEGYEMGTQVSRTNTLVLTNRRARLSLPAEQQHLGVGHNELLAKSEHSLRHPFNVI